MKDSHVIYAKASEVKITSDDKIQLNLDGEYGGDAPAYFKNLKRHIELFVPIDDIRELDRYED